MLNLLRRVRRLGIGRRTAAILLALNAAAILFEGLGIGMLVPVFQYMQSGGDLAKLQAAGAHWRILIDAYGSVGLVLSLPLLLVTCFGAILARQAFIYLRHSYKARRHLEAVHELRARMFRRLLGSRTAYHDDATAGSIVNDLATEITQAANVVFTIIAVIGSVLLIAFYLGAMLFFAPWLTLASLAVIVITMLTMRRMLRRSRKLSGEVTAANAAFSTFLVERLRSLRLVRLAGMEKPEVENLVRLSDTQRNRQVRLKLVGLRIGAMMEPVALALGLGIVYAGYAVFALPVELLGLFLFAMIRLLPMAKEILADVHTALGQMASLEAVERRFAALDQAREPKGGTRVFAGLDRGLVFDAVTYTYPQGDAPALDKVGLAIPANKLVAIIGPSGSGKSTLIDLIPRLRDPSAGTITADDVPLAEFSVASLRAGVSFVPQSPFLFNVTIAEHIRYGRPEARDAEVEAAAAVAGVASFVHRLPQGYATLCGESGVKLSAGQRQRIDLARAVLRGGRILILDEPTSALDADAEDAFREALRRLRARGDLTVIVVAHRLHSIADADLVIVLEHGRLIESGSPDQLLRRGGWYASALGRRPMLPASVAGAA